MLLNQILNIFLFTSLLVDLATQLIGIQSDDILSAYSAKSLIASLPNLTFPLQPRHFSGYLSSLNSTHLFYWFIESLSSPQDDPLLLWLTGGPGCSSLFGALNEIGPILMSPNGTLFSNQYAWIRNSNLLFIESPAGTGFSYRANFTRQYCTNDNETALINYHALRSFYKQFPQYSSRTIFLSGQSYAAHYVTQLGEEILKRQQEQFPIKLGGVFLGNGLYYTKLNRDYLRQYMSVKGFDQYSFGPKEPSFSRKLWAFGINREDCLFTSTAYNPYVYVPETRLPASVQRSEEACLSDQAINRYLNRVDVQRAFHVDSSFTTSSFNWTLCSIEKKGYLKYEYNVNSIETHFRALFQSGIPIVLYNGDADPLCHYIGAQKFVEDELKLKPMGNKEIFKDEAKVYGTLQQYENNLLLVVFYNASHMVPIDEPKGVLKLLTEKILKLTETFK